MFVHISLETFPFNMAWDIYFFPEHVESGKVFFQVFLHSKTSLVDFFLIRSNYSEVCERWAYSWTKNTRIPALVQANMCYLEPERWSNNLKVQGNVFSTRPETLALRWCHSGPSKSYNKMRLDNVFPSSLHLNDFSLKLLQLWMIRWKVWTIFSPVARLKKICICKRGPVWTV